MKTFNKGKVQTKKNALTNKPREQYKNETCNRDYNDNSIISQHYRIVRRLRQTGSFTTEEGRNDLRIYQVPARISELRRNGFNISTVMERHYTADGVRRPIARYILISEPEEPEVFDLLKIPQRSPETRFNPSILRASK